MSKGYRFYVDTETTGFDDRKDQILELAGVVHDSNGLQVDQFEYKVKLKENVIPGPKAILINKINPFSRIWAAESITENECAKQFASLVKKYSPEGGPKPFFTAYNADFDKDKCAVMFARNGFKFSSLFNKSVFDPLKTVRRLTAAGVIQTKLNKFRKPSNSQEDVAEALGIEYDGEAHRALTDVGVLVKVTQAVVKLSTDNQNVSLSADPSSYKPGSVVRVVSDSKSSGIKIRHLLVLKNEVNSEFIVALDEDDLKTGFKPSSVRQFNYGTIIGEGTVDESVEIDLHAEFKKSEQDIAALVEQKIKPEPFDEGPQFDEESKNFEMIEQIQEHMVKTQDKRKLYDFMLENIKSKFNGDEMSAKAMMTRVENLACAKGYQGWSQELFPQEGIRFLPPQVVSGAELRVALHPMGHYAVGLSYDKNGVQAKELKDCKTIKDLKAFVSARVGKVPALTEFMDELPMPEKFADPKHSIVIESEVKAAIDELLVHGASDDVKAGISGVIQKLQKISPTVFNKYKLPIDPSLLNEKEYWVGKQTPSSRETASPSDDGKTESSSDDEHIAPDHLIPGDKMAKAPCALCGRALSAQLSLENSLGPTCRKHLQAIESSEQSLESQRDPYKPFVPGSSHRAGDLVAVQYRTMSGKDNELLGELINVTPNHTYVLDRKKLKASIEAGITPELSIYLSTIKFPHGSISGVAKLKAS